MAGGNKRGNGSGHEQAGDGHAQLRTGPARALNIRLLEAFAPINTDENASADLLAARFRQDGDATLGEISGFSACLLPLLQALEWRDDRRKLADAMPHYADSLDLTGFRNLLANLGYITTPKRCRIDDLDPRLLPCLFIPDDGPVLVLTAATAQGYAAFDAGRNEYTEISGNAVTGVAYLTRRKTADSSANPLPVTKNWLGDLVRRFRKTIMHLLVLTLVLNLLAIVPPLFLMLIYDIVIPGRSTDVLTFLCLGVGFLLLCEIGLRFLRGRLMAHIAARADHLIAVETFKKILNLPPAQIERASVGHQIARLKEFETLREVFTGPLASVVLELPFLVLFLGVIAIISGPLALVPIAMIVLFGIAAAMLYPSIRRVAGEAAAAQSEYRGFLVEALSHMRAIKQSAGEEAWIARCRDLGARAALGDFKTTQVNLLLQTIAHGLMMLAGIVILAGGVLQILTDNMSVGALIATMALTWRVLSPISAGLVTLTRFEQIKAGVKKINTLMAMPSEASVRAASPIKRNITGLITFNRVSFRYAPDAQPALMNVSFQARPGQLIALTGGNGCGKSTVLKLIAGFDTAQGGQITIDGIDLHQLDRPGLRKTIGYVPQNYQHFHGTIAQNLRLSQPMARDGELQEACRRAGVLEDIEALEDGFETRIGDQQIHRLAAGFQQRLGLARAYLRPAPILLLDEAEQGLDQRGEQALSQSLKRLKGHTTTIMVTHRPSLMKLADLIIVLEHGQVVANGPPSSIEAQMAGAA